MVLHYAVNKRASEYLRDRVWEPIGAEADATWLLDAEGFELAHFGFNAVLRDYARLAACSLMTARGTEDRSFHRRG